MTVEYVCTEFDLSTQDCLHWAVEQDTVLLAQLATMTPVDRWAITFSIAGFLITVWMIIQIKRMLK